MSLSYSVAMSLMINWRWKAAAPWSTCTAASAFGNRRFGSGAINPRKKFISSSLQTTSSGKTSSSRDRQLVLGPQQVSQLFMPGEQIDPTQQFDQHIANTRQVTSGRRFVVLQDFRGRIQRRAFAFTRRRLVFKRRSHVDQLGVTASLQHDVGRLDVAVHDAFAVQAPPAPPDIRGQSQRQLPP